VVGTAYTHLGEVPALCVVPRIISYSVEFMRQVIAAGLGIGFCSPVGFVDEIVRGELVHVPLPEPGLAESAIGILVPPDRRPTLAGRIAMDAVRVRLREFAERMNGVAGGRKGRGKKG
jgi:DNA-binding transcriptional LysR family regulator